MSRARDDLAAGRPEEARDRLRDLVEVSDDRGALDALGEAHYALGDLPEAAAAWFGTGRKGPEVQEATDAWRAHHRDDFAEMWRSLPASVREADEQIPRIAALQRKAIESDPSLDRVVYDPHPAPAESQPEADADEPVGRDGAAPDSSEELDPAAADELPAMDDPGVVEVEHVDELDEADSRDEVATPDESDESDESDEPEATSLRAAEGASATLRPAGDRPKLGKVVPAGSSERKGIDTAMVIALALALFAVICAIVGLVTIVRWVVPG